MHIKLFLPLLGIVILTAYTKSKLNEVELSGKSCSSEIPDVFMPGSVSIKGRLEQGFSISPDYREMLVGVIGNHDTLCTIYHSKYAHRSWSKLETKEFIGNDSVFFPMFSPNGNMLTFTKRYPGSMQTDIWYCKKENDKWLNAKRYPASVNSEYREGSSCLSAGNTLYFTSNRDTGRACCGDIYRIKLPNQPHAIADKLDNVNTIWDEEGVFVSPQENFIIFQSWKPRYKSKHDLFISYLLSDKSWSTPERLDTLINTTGLEQRPFVTADNKYLFFNRMSVDEKFNPIESDIYWVSTKKVFKPYLYRQLADTTVNINEEFTIQLPFDLFKDIDDKELDYCIKAEGRMELPTWLSFDSNKMCLTGKANKTDDYQLVIQVTDKSGNSTEESFILIVN